MHSLEAVIPVIDWPSDARGYNSVPVDLKDPRSSDPLVRLRDFGIAGESFYGRADGRNWPYNCKLDGCLSDLWCRRLVAEKLQKINEFLKTSALELYVWDAYRSIKCQVSLWNFFRAKASAEMPNATDADSIAFVARYVSDPTRFRRDDPRTWPTHCTGGAIDLTLRHLDTLQLCDMGGRFDDPNIVSQSDYYERYPPSLRNGKIETIRRNRRLLHFAMGTQGFVNYPLEFWHFDWGTQMYVHNLRLLSGSAPHAAWFGYVPSPED